MSNPFDFVSSGMNWLKNQLIIFAIFTPVFLVYKYLMSSILEATADNFDNFILRMLVRLILPGLVGVGVAYLGILLHCDALTKFALFIAMAVGGIITYGILYLLNSFVVPVPFFMELSMIFLILIVLSILENILPMFMPLGFLISIILSLVQLVVIYIYGGGQISGMAQCFVHAVYGKAIPGTGGISIGA